jgi:hypothetical protein
VSVLDGRPDYLRTTGSYPPHPDEAFMRQIANPYNGGDAR